MNLEHLKTLLVLAENSPCESLNVWTPQGWKAPKGFPRRELLCCPSKGGNTWRINREKLLAWAFKQ